VGGFSAFVFLLCAGFLNRLLEEREALAERQARQQRLASLGEMSAVLAHEIRNPLTSLKGHAQLLSETSPEEGKARKKADRIASEVGRLEALVNDLLDFVRAGTVDLRETDPLLILREAVTLIEGGERVRVVSEGTTTSWNLDPIRFRQVLVNLIQNACQVSPEGAEVEVTLGSKRGVLEIRVQDRGPGVPEGEEERIFEPFVTGRSHGTGLGLAVARRLTELHGGTLKVVSSEGIGACFQARFPRVEDQEGR
jgi:two-component system sensor histidine kinase HydH